MIQLTSRKPLHKTEVRVLTYSDDRFGAKGGAYRKTQQAMHEVFFRHPDIHQVVNKTEHDLLKTSFYRKHKDVLSRGNLTIHAGCMQKIFFIKEELDKMGEGEYLLYHDCSPEIWDFENDKYHEYRLQPLLEMCTSNKGVIMADTGSDSHSHHQFTSSKCIDLMGAHEHRHKVQDCASWILMQNTPFVRSFIAEALHFVEMEDCFAMRKHKEYDRSINPDFNEHRGDQSVMSLLLHKKGMRNLPRVSPRVTNVYLHKNVCKGELHPVILFFDLY